MEEELERKRNDFFENTPIGTDVKGVVKSFTSFGAFIDLGGRKVTDVLQVGDSVTVTVIDVNPEKNKISLSLKDINTNPWNNVAEKYPIGEIVEGKVVRLAAFGAFVMLEEGLDGLVHISQIADKHVAKPDDELTVGEMIQVKVTDIDEENHKISLSKREADIMLRPEYDGAEQDDYDEEMDYAEADEELFEAEAEEAEVME